MHVRDLFDLSGRDVEIVRDVVRPTRPPRHDVPVPPVEPDDGPVRPVPSDGTEAPVVGLEDVRSVTQAIAKRLRRAGIDTANELVATPETRLRDVLGNRTNTIRKAAIMALRLASRPREDS